MKCLSIRQPWASLIVAGSKDVENRTWPTKYRGPVLIHAALTADISSISLPDGVLNRSITELPRGVIIGQATIVNCVRNHPSPWAGIGAWHWVLANAKAFDRPVPYPGRLGLFDAPEPDGEHLFKPHDGQTRRVCLRDEPCDVVITRPGKWGNPYRIEKQRGIWVVCCPDGIRAPYGGPQGAAKYATRKYTTWMKEPGRAHLVAALPELRGKRLGCFCKPGAPCHGDVLARLVEAK